MEVSFYQKGHLKTYQADAGQEVKVRPKGAVTSSASNDNSNKKQRMSVPDVPLCKCGEEAKELTVTDQTSANCGRQFLTCASRPGCGFFKFSDGKPSLKPPKPKVNSTAQKDDDHQSDDGADDQGKN